MYEITIENKYGDKLKLTGNHNYTVKATGLSPVSSNIVTSTVANYGGERYVSSRQNKRNIVLTIYINEPVESNRVELYKYIKSDDQIRIYYKNGARDVYIDGYVESFETNLFEQIQSAQVSIICPQPQFVDVLGKTVRLSSNIELFTFPFYANEAAPIVFSQLDNNSRLVINGSDDEIGFVYEISCHGEVKNPFIYHTESNSYIKINSTFHNGDVVTIDTRHSKKSITKDYLGVKTNLINSLDSISKWIQLQSGYNHLVQSSDYGSDDMESIISYTNEYEGV